MRRATDGSVQVKGYISLLRDRLEDLEKKARDRGISPSTIATAAGDDGEHHGDFTGLNETDNNVGSAISQLPLSAMGEPKAMGARDVSWGLSMPKIIDSITQTYGGNPEATSGTDALWSSIAKDLRRNDNMVPQRLNLTREEAFNYMNTYFQAVDFRYPRLPRGDIERGILAITAASDADYIQTLSGNPAWVFMAYLVMAITPLVSDTYPISQASFVSVHVLSKALKLLDRVFQEEDGVDILHCLRLLVIFSLHSAAAGSAWHLMGIAMKKCIALGFHREANNTAMQSHVQDMEQKRWAFWSCYLLDR